MLRSRVCQLVLATVVPLLVVLPAEAQTTYGVRAGIAADPDQLVVGGHLESPGLTSSGRLRLRPSVEIGVGDDSTVVSGNIDFVYVMDFPASEWSTYFGGGPSFNIVHEDFSGNDIHSGANFIAGFQHTTGLLLELRAGGGQGATGLKVMAGYNFKRNRN
jgi:hypothetical protein